jgi:hypothetical protein
MSNLIKIAPEILYKIFGLGSETVENFQLMDDTITGSDVEDGGADHDYVLKELSTGNFYSGSYTDWDVDNTDYDEEFDKCGERVDFNTNLTQVFPKTKTITIYD